MLEFRIIFLILVVYSTLQCILANETPKDLSTLTQKELDDYFMNEALLEAKLGLSEGGIPIGSVLVKDNKIIGRGHNLRVQTGSPIQHGEMNAIDNAGRLTADVYVKSTIYTTLSPCQMCSGAIGFFNIPRVVIAENKNFHSKMGEDLLKNLGRDVVVLNNKEATEMMAKFIKENPGLWSEDISIISERLHQGNENEGHTHLEVVTQEEDKVNTITDLTEDDTTNIGYTKDRSLRLYLSILSFCILLTLYLTFLYFSSKRKKNSAYESLPLDANY